MDYNDFDNNPVLERCFKDRILFLGMPIDECVSSWIEFGIYELNSVSNEPITIYLNSPGGNLISGMKILTAIRNSTAPISTINIGQVDGMATYILMAGAKGMRFALSSSFARFNYVTRETSGNQIVYISHEADKYLVGIMRKRTLLSEKQYHDLCDSERVLDGLAQKNFKIVDAVIQKRQSRGGIRA